MSAAAPRANALPRPASAADIGRAPVNVLLYGAPGTGKTTFAASCPGPTLFFDVDGGLRSITSTKNPEKAKIFTELSIDPAQIFYFPIRSLADLFNRIEQVSNEFRADSNRYGTIALDTLTELQRVLIEDILRSQNRATPQLQDWNVVLLQMQRIVRAIKALPCHSVFLAHEQTKDGRIVPALSGQILTELPAYMDEVWRYVVAEQESISAQGQRVVKLTRMIRCNYATGMMTKSRAGCLPDWHPPIGSKLIPLAQAA